MSSMSLALSGLTDAMKAEVEVAEEVVGPVVGVGWGGDLERVMWRADVTPYVFVHLPWVFVQSCKFLITRC